ncbi:DMT family transporter [Pseudobacteroides cellulosolvens]|uniref:EamA domain-containing protein n=1 Tax=Pseudobacteroides cellulosolvens ATCC 35603 = DSM 2933 TaxID=398512 RepID=A0A0L6JQ94_9FIRM|nr:DMT family transporter [Pseudobacteroides cellulosolvens]KNY27958.1 protein of unknown function DUF6 transmembrane [Pseudobacteroides cellulosolvens ATCC 35603 = DSM 2933]
MDKLKGSFYLFCAFSLAGTSVISARFVSGQLGTFTIAALSLLFAILGLLPVCGFRLISEMKLIHKMNWIIILLQAFFGIFLFRMFLLNGLLHTSSGEAGILTGATPAVTVVLARVILKEHLNKQKIIGILSTIVGILLIQGILLPQRSFSLMHLYGNILVVCAAISESMFNILSRINSVRLVANGQKPLDPIIQTTLVSITAFILCLIPSILENPVLPIKSLNLKQWGSLVWYGLFVTALAFIFWYAGIKRCTASTAAVFSGMMPFTALILSSLVLGENVRWEQWSGGILIVFGILGIEAMYPQLNRQ